MNLELVFDGGNGASVEKEAYGSFRIKNEVFEHSYKISFGAGFTNNEAEYKTLLYALEYISNIYTAGNIYLTIKGDSELVRRQIGTYVEKAIFRCANAPSKIIWIDDWQVKKPHLLPLRNEARRLLELFKSFTYIHIPRKEVVVILGH